MTLGSDADRSLTGLTILVVDDEALIALNLEDMLQEEGAETVAASTVPSALEVVARETLAAAALDVRLGRDTTETVADALTERQIPFLFYSGDSLPPELGAKYPHAPVLMKPVGYEAFVGAIARIARPRPE